MGYRTAPTIRSESRLTGDFPYVAGLNGHAVLHVDKRQVGGRLQ